jgi:hypothetical protein
VTGGRLRSCNAKTGYVEVEIQRPITWQKVLLKKFYEWLTRASGSPKEMIQRQRVKDLLK